MEIKKLFHLSKNCPFIDEINIYIGNLEEFTNFELLVMFSKNDGHTIY